MIMFFQPFTPLFKSELFIYASACMVYSFHDKNKLKSISEFCKVNNCHRLVQIVTLKPLNPIFKR